MDRKLISLLALLGLFLAANVATAQISGTVQQLKHNVQIDDAVTLTLADIGALTVVVNTADTDANIYTLPDCEAVSTAGNPPYEPVGSSIGARARFAMTAAFDVTVNPIDTDQIVGPFVLDEERHGFAIVQCILRFPG